MLRDFAGPVYVEERGFRFVGARATVCIPKRDAIPITVEGEQLGETWGDIQVEARESADQKTMHVRVDVPTLGTKLPEASKHAVQALEPTASVSIGVHRAPRELTVLPLALDNKGAEDKTADPCTSRSRCT